MNSRRRRLAKHRRRAARDSGFLFVFGRANSGTTRTVPYDPTMQYFTQEDINGMMRAYFHAARLENQGQ